MGTRLGQVGDEKFSNWVKDTLALLYTKECLEMIADERSAVFHGQLKTAVGNTSTCTCSWEALNQDRKHQKWVVKNCPGVCQNWLDLIISHHSNGPLPKLAPRNTDPSRWPLDTWEVMKVYQSYGCQGHHSARDADVAVLIDLMRNCNHFAPLITNPSLINQVITVRNKLMHSKDFKVENQELSHDLQSMLSFLRSLTTVSGASSLSATEHQAVQAAITEVDKLRTSILDMTLNRELQLKALKAKQVALETDMKLLEQTINDARADTAAVQSGLTGVEDKLSTEVQTLQQRLLSQLSKIQDVKKGLASQLSMIQDVKKDMTSQQSMIQDIKKDMTVQQQSTATVVSNLAHLQQQFDDLKIDLDDTKNNITALKERMTDLEVTSQQQASKITTIYQRQQATESELQNQQQETHAHANQLYHYQKEIDTHTAKLDRLENKQMAQQTDGAMDIKGLQRQLISMYKAWIQHFPVYLLMSERKICLEDIYVEQRLKVVDPEGRSGTDILLKPKDRSEAGKNEQFMNSLRDAFYSEGNKCQYVYVSGNAGYGKSIFCSHLVRLWCKAHSQNTTELTPDEELMAEFPLLFCVDLRDAMYDGTFQTPDEMCSLVQKQLQQSGIALPYDYLSKLLQADGQVLVVMDALDECKEQRLPRGGKCNNCTTLVTSRPWKFEALRRDPECRVDEEFEIVGLKKGSSEDLAENLVKLLNKKWNKGKDSKAFIRKMEEEGLQEFLDVPVILTSMLCLWFDDIPFGQSQVEVYKNSIHHHILTAVKAKNIQEGSEYSCPSEVPFPICHRERCPCQTYGKLLWKISELACKALLGNVRERSRVMDHDQTHFLGLTDEDVAICMKLGMLTQYKLLGNVTDYEPQKSVSFTHKTYKEWFAAIYLSSKLPVSELDKLLSEAINDLDSALELDQMILFVCGLSEEVSAKLYTFIMSKASSDTRVQEYRMSDNIYSDQLIRTIQDVAVAGAVEAKKNNKMSKALQLQDVHIKGHSGRFSTEQILACDTSQARSVYINDVRIGESDVEKRKITPWPASPCLERLVLWDITNALDDTFCDNFSAEHLGCLLLNFVTLTHDQLERLCTSLASAGSLRTVNIYKLTCITHQDHRQISSNVVDSSRLPRLNELRLLDQDNKQNCSIMLGLSRHQGLEKLTLKHLGVGEVQGISLCQNKDKLEEVELYNVTLTHDGLERLCGSLASPSRLKTVDIEELTCKTHQDNRKECYIQLDLSQYERLKSLSLENKHQSGWQLPNVKITSWPSSSCMETVDLRRVDMSPCDTFCDNFIIDMVSKMYLENVILAHDQLESLCGSLATTGSLRTVDIRELICKTHKDNRQECYIQLEFSQYERLKSLSLETENQSGWLLPNVKITS